MEGRSKRTGYLGGGTDRIVHGALGRPALRPRVSLAAVMSEVPARIGPYAIESRLGAGGMAETFVANRNMQGVEQRVCVKRILPAYAKDTTARRLFLREANISAQLRHANLVTILDVGEDAGSPYLVMELVEGSDLGGILERAPDKKLPPDLVAFVLAEMAHGLQEAHGGGGAHAGVVHRDLSPGNVLVSTMGEVKVADFGIAKALSGEKATATLMRGKFAYMAPEQLNGAPLDPRADFFALGVMGYEMVAGVRPFEAEHDARLVLLIAKNERRHLAEVAPGVPRDLLDTIEALLSPNREDRPGDGHAIVERLASAVPPSMVARRKMGALARAALEARLNAEGKDATAPDASGSMPAFAPTISAADAQLPPPTRQTPRRDESEPNVHALPTKPLPAKEQPRVVEPIGTNPSLSDRLPPSAIPGMGRSPFGMIALAAVALLALVGGGVLVSSSTSTPEQAPGEPGSPPSASVAVSTPTPTTTPIPTPTTTTPIAIPSTTPVSDPPHSVGSAPHTPSPHGSHRSPTPTPAPTPTPTPTTPPTTPETATTVPTAPAEAEPSASAELGFGVTPWGNIWVDHRFLGRAPLTVPVTPGSHVVQAGFDSPLSTRTVRVRAGQRQHVDFDLTEQ